MCFVILPYLRTFAQVPTNYRSSAMLALHRQQDQQTRRIPYGSTRKALQTYCRYIVWPNNSMSLITVKLMINSSIATNDTVTNEPIELLLANISTVDNLKTKYTHRQIKDAERARKFQNIIGTTTIGVLQTIDLKIMSNCPVTRQSIKDALHIFGPSMTNLKGKVVRVGAKQVELTEETINPILPFIISYHAIVMWVLVLMPLASTKYSSLWYTVIQLNSVLVHK